MSTLRVLLVAKTCDPDGRAGFLIDWLQAAMLRRRLDVHIVSATANRTPLLRASGVPDIAAGGIKVELEPAA